MTWRWRRRFAMKSAVSLAGSGSGQFRDGVTLELPPGEESGEMVAIQMPPKEQRWYHQKAPLS